MVISSAASATTLQLCGCPCSPPLDSERPRGWWCQKETWVVTTSLCRAPTCRVSSKWVLPPVLWQNCKCWGRGLWVFGACDSLTQRFVPVLDCSSRSPLLCPSVVPAQRVVENPSLLYIPSQTNFNHFLTAAGAMCGHVILLSHSLLVLHQLSFLWPMVFFSPIFLCTCWNGPISAPRRGEQPFDGCGRWHLGMGALEGDFSLYIRESIKPHLPKKN